MAEARSTRCACIAAMLTLLASVLIVEGAAKKCPRNEFYTDCGSPCQTLCATLHEPCNIVNIRCPDGCYCKKGYARDNDGVCIAIEQCGGVYA